MSRTDGDIRKNRKIQGSKKGRAIHLDVFGVVQGVGFRPSIYRLATRLGYKGWVKNIGRGVMIHLEKQEDGDFKDFLEALRKNAPPLARIEDISLKPAAFRDFTDFAIKKSGKGESFVSISPDIAVCPACLEEIQTPSERRFRYAFTNCTDCGPRYTIVQFLPYDRKNTTMAGFPMCRDCEREYSDPLDRRYHAQPIACPACGPSMTLVEAGTGKLLEGGIEKAALLIKKGKILAVKGLGGFHLICDPFNPEAVERLRTIKERRSKPFALMAADVEMVEEYARLFPSEKSLLFSARRPVVLLRKKKDIPFIAPHLDELGFMLPYTPLHTLLIENLGLIVATSSNKKDAPIIKDETEGIDALCDFILTHDRPIEMRADDSVMKVVDDGPLFVRRARGYVPHPQRVPAELESPVPILAVGGELKNTVSLYKNGYVVTSQFLGDMDDYRNFHYFEETVSHLSHLFGVSPKVIVSDLHPDFRTTRYARKSGLRHFQVQHHFAHILAPLLEHKIPPELKVLGVALDGYGYGEDGTAWGGEFLVADYSSYERTAHFKCVPLPGGDLAAKQPWRMALSFLRDCFGSRIPSVRSLEMIPKKKREGVLAMMEMGFNSPLTSSCGRLFDAISFLVGLAPPEVEYEAEAPMRLESIASENTEESYAFLLSGNVPPYQVSFAPAVEGVLRDVEEDVPPSLISARFHNTLAEAVAAVAQKTRDTRLIETVALVGGVFLNKKLLTRTSSLLKEKGFLVLRPMDYSPNDESLSLGQVAFALARLKTEGIKS